MQNIVSDVVAFVGVINPKGISVIGNLKYFLLPRNAKNNRCTLTWDFFGLNCLKTIYV